MVNGVRASQPSALTQLVEAARDISEAEKALAVQKAAPTTEPNLPPKVGEKGKPGVEIAPSEPADVKALAALNKKKAAFIRSLAHCVDMNTPANRQEIRDALKPATIADALAASDPKDYMQRRAVAMAFAGASEGELLPIIAALADTKGKKPAEIEADRTTIFRLIFFPRPDSGVTAGLITAAKGHGFSNADIEEHRAEVA